MVKKTKMTDADQIKAFKQAARELGCYDDEKAFDKVLKKISSAPPPKSVRERKDKGTKRAK